MYGVNSVYSLQHDVSNRKYIGNTNYPFRWSYISQTLFKIDLWSCIEIDTKINKSTLQNITPHHIFKHCSGPLFWLNYFSWMIGSFVKTSARKLQRNNLRYNTGENANYFKDISNVAEVSLERLKVWRFPNYPRGFRNEL
jgi:hypothetical protein